MDISRADVSMVVQRFSMVSREFLLAFLRFVFGFKGTSEGFLRSRM